VIIDESGQLVLSPTSKTRSDYLRTWSICLQSHV